MLHPGKLGDSKRLASERKKGPSSRQGEERERLIRAFGKRREDLCLKVW